MRRVLVLLGSGFAASASPALADWQHTRWGMSVSEVVTSSAGEAAPVKGTDGDQVRGQDLGAEGTYDAGGFNFTFRLSPADCQQYVCTRTIRGLARCWNEKSARFTLLAGGLNITALSEI